MTKEMTVRELVEIITQLNQLGGQEVESVATFDGEMLLFRLRYRDFRDVRCWPLVGITDSVLPVEFILDEARKMVETFIDKANAPPLGAW